MVSATRTPIKPGDPIWVTTPGQHQGEPGVLVRLEPGRNTVTVQLLSEAAGAHTAVELGRVCYRRDGDKPPPPQPAPVAPTPTATSPPDAFDQLIALFPKVIERLESDLQAARGRRDQKRQDLSAEVRCYREVKKLRAAQIRRLRSALKVLTRPKGTSRGGSNASSWTPERRKAAGDRVRKMNVARAEKRSSEKVAT